MAGPKNEKKPYRVPAIRDLRADTPEGHCVFCQEPFVEGWQARRGGLEQDVCGDLEVERDAKLEITNECAKNYHRLYMAKTRAEKRDALNLTDTTNARMLLARAQKLLARVERRTAAARLASERA